MDEKFQSEFGMQDVSIYLTIIIACAEEILDCCEV